MSSAYEIYEQHYFSIRNLVRTADIYTIHAFANLKKQEADLKLINKVMKNSSGHSTLVNAWYFHMTKEENNLLRKDPNIRAMSEQIVTSSYVLIEYYLVNKFKELIEQKIPDKNIAKAINKVTYQTSLNKLNERYKNFFDIQISLFDPDVCLYENNWFNPKTCWEGLTMMSIVRNEVAHTGKSNTYEISYLLDAYTAYDFAREWIGYFEMHVKTLNRLSTRIQ